MMQAANRFRAVWVGGPPATLLLAAALCWAEPLTVPWLIPADEHDAQRMLAEGALDTTSWELLQPYYAEPLNVLRGGLIVLEELFPGLMEGVPVEPDSLSRYEPWSLADIQRFLGDYPALVGFVPILSFEPPQSSKWGTLRVRLKRIGDNATQRQYVNLSFSPHDVVAVRSRWSFGQDNVAWRRRLSVDVPGVGTVTAGNYMPSLDDGLFMGHFGTSPDDSLSPLERALFGEGRAYNGFLWEQRFRDRAQVQAFYHAGAGEVAGGLRTQFGVRDWLATRLAFSLLDTSRGPEPASGLQYAVHGGLLLRLSSYRLGVYTCAATARMGSIPWVVTLEHSGRSRSIRTRAVYLPAGFEATRGRLTRSIRTGLGPSSHGDIVSMELVGRQEFGTYLSISPSLTYVRSSGAAKCRAGIALASSRPFTSRLRYTYEPSLLDAQPVADRHTALLSMMPSFGRRVSGVLAARVYLRGTEYRSMRFRAAPHILLGKGTEIVPYSVVRYSSASGTVVDVGFRHELRLFDSVRGGYSLEMPCEREGWEELFVNATLRFAL